MLAILNNAAMNNVLLKFLFPQGICLGVGLLGPMVVLVLVV